MNFTVRNIKKSYFSDKPISENFLSNILIPTHTTHPQTQQHHQTNLP